MSKLGLGLSTLLLATDLAGCSPSPEDEDPSKEAMKAASISPSLASFVEHLSSARSRVFEDLTGEEQLLEELGKRTELSVVGSSVLKEKECKRRAEKLNGIKRGDNENIASSSTPIDWSPVVDTTAMQGCVELPDKSTGFFLFVPSVSVSSREGWSAKDPGLLTFKTAVYPTPLSPYNSAAQTFALGEVACRYWTIPLLGGHRPKLPLEAKHCGDAVYLYEQDVSLDDVRLVLTASLEGCIDEGIRSGAIRDPEFLCHELGVDPSYGSDRTSKVTR